MVRRGKRGDEEQKKYPVYLPEIHKQLLKKEKTGTKET